MAAERRTVTHIVLAMDRVRGEHRHIRWSAVRNRAVLAFVVSAGAAAAVWALSVPLTGKNEPWDGDGPYYVLALAIAGAISGSLIPKHLGLHYIGAIAGQVAYELAFLKLGALFILGLAFLAGYSIIFLAGAAILATLRADHIAAADSKPERT